ncbi:MAG: hypothetical protein E2598_11270 [Sphingobium sp.]|nr:hypothetical protein [Sphingobium sp.]
MKMKRIAAVAASIIALGWANGPVSASGDYSCSPSWALSPTGDWDCANRASLAANNDTRVNMLFLQAAGGTQAPRNFAYPKADWEDYNYGRSFFSWDRIVQIYTGDAGYSDGYNYGSRCDSLASGTEAFAAAIAANRRLSGADREALTTARANLSGRCPDRDRRWQDGNAGANAVQPAAVWPQRLSNASAQAFLGYLLASDAFYAGSWDSAREGFAALQKAPDEWVAETASYMLIRVGLNAAQDYAFGEYGDFDMDDINQIAVNQVHAAIGAYLKTYPKGRYAASATGLKRRALWLAGDKVGLAREYERMLTVLRPGSAEAAALIQEIDNKLLFEQDAGEVIQGPQLLAAFHLLQIREDKGNVAQSLAAQKNVFAKTPALYAYLIAAQAFYQAKDYRRVLQLVPAAPQSGGTSQLAFSQQMLRGMALAELHDPQEEKHWRDLLKVATGPYQQGLVELGLALMWQNAANVPAVFAPASPIQDTAIRSILLSRVAGPDLLRQVAGDRNVGRSVRDVALFALLQKSLQTGRYADFGRDVKMVPADAQDNKPLWGWSIGGEGAPVAVFTKGKWADGFACPALPQTAATLAQNPRDAKARLCLGDFWRLNGFDNFSALDPLEEAKELGGGKDYFPGRRIPRAALYDGLIADPHTPADAKAYALYRAIRCYAPSGMSDCGGEEAPVAQRKAWFQQLKRDYGATRWAKDLPYYW